MDDLARYNQERWEALAQAGVEYSRPWLDLDPDTARRRVDPYGMIGAVAGLRVLCLAGGGGQQSAAFGLLGAEVTVLDLSETQLERDRQAAAHYGLHLRTIQGDMRDLSGLPTSQFDVVWHAHSITFVPDAVAVFRQVTRVLREGGLYYVGWHNPFVMGTSYHDRDGRGYALKHVYRAGEVVADDPTWSIADADGRYQRIVGPREFRHTLSTVVNGLAGLGYRILGIWEESGGDPSAEPGSWEHYLAVVVPYLGLWARWQPQP
jgi:SAM-dependent methyltransferase